MTVMINLRTERDIFLWHALVIKGGTGVSRSVDYQKVRKTKIKNILNPSIEESINSICFRLVINLSSRMFYLFIGNFVAGDH